MQIGFGQALVGVGDAQSDQEDRNAQTAGALVKVSQGGTLTEEECTAITTTVLTSALVASSVAEGATFAVAFAAAAAAMVPVTALLAVSAAISAAYVAIYNALFPVTKLKDVSCDPGNAPTGPDDPNWQAWNWTQGGKHGDPLHVPPKSFDAFAGPVLAKNFEDQLNCRASVSVQGLMQGLVTTWNATHDGPIVVRPPGDFATNPVDRALTASEGWTGPPPAIMTGPLNMGALTTGIFAKSSTTQKNPGNLQTTAPVSNASMSTGAKVAIGTVAVVGTAVGASAIVAYLRKQTIGAVWKGWYNQTRALVTRKRVAVHR